MRLYFSFLLLLICFTGLEHARAAEGRIPISGPRTITEAGSYLVTNDFTASTGNAIVINVNNVTIDLDGHTVQASNGWGIWGNSNKTNIKLLGGFVVGSAGGVSLYAPGGNFQVETLNITVTGAGGDGLQVLGGTGNPANSVVKGNIITRTVLGAGFGILSDYSKGRVEENSITRFSIGIELDNNSNVFVEKNYCGNNASGIRLTSSINNALRNNILSQNSEAGMIILAGAYNTISDNSASANAAYGIYVGSNTNNLDRNTTACDVGGGVVGIYLAGCGNIYSNNKIPGTCTIQISTGCGANPNIDGGGNTL